MSYPPPTDRPWVCATVMPDPDYPVRYFYRYANGVWGYTSAFDKAMLLWGTHPADDRHRRVVAP